MGQVATVTIGSDTFSVYAITADPVADATSYFNGQLTASATAWTAATSDNKKRALVQAVRWMDRAVSWSGTKTSAGQPLDWPREGATCDGVAVAGSPSVPNEVAYAEFELAGLILVDASASESTGTGSNVKSVQAGSAAVSFFSPTTGTSADTRLPIVAHDLIKCLFGGSALAVEKPLANGVDECSQFTRCDFEVWRGY